MRSVDFKADNESSWDKFDKEECEFDRRIDALGDEVIRIRRHLHSHPEPSGEEVETSAYLARRLNDAGVSARVCRSDAGNPVGVIADLTIGRPADDCPLIAIRADIDALRMPDEKDVEYRSLNPGVTHACGHDAHASIALGLALAAAELDGATFGRAELAGLRLRFLFQSAEETSEGARWLVDQHALDDVHAILGLHVDPERRAGEVGVRYGTLTANCDEIDIRVDGHGGHAARPHHSHDPISAAAQLIGALYQQLPRAVDSRHPAVFTIGQITGGYAPNVIPERVDLRGTLRTTDLETRQTIKLRVESICNGIAEATGTSIAARFSVPLGSVNNDPRVTAVVEAAARRVLGSENVHIIERPSMGGEDFSVYLDRVPGSLMRLGCGRPGMKSPFLHSPLFDIDERILNPGMKILIRAAMLLSEAPQHSQEI